LDRIAELALLRDVYISKLSKYWPQNAQQIEGSCGFSTTETTYFCPIFVPYFQMQRPDGYSMLGGWVQGARTYDPTSGQWLTPDPYAGDVADPMSQKPFMWNGNNPVEWSDASGYCTDPTPGQKPNGCLGGVDWNLNMNFANALQMILSWVAIPAGGEAGAGAKAAVLAGKVGNEEIERAIMSITDQKLGNYANNLFKVRDIILGGTAGAVRREIAKGVATQGVWHSGKAQQTIADMTKWLAANRATLSPQNLHAAEVILEDLKDAVSSGTGAPTINELYQQELGEQVPPQ
jgi:RHS repeat-associated protein